MVLNPQFWAEDGRVFFRQAHEHGIAALFVPSGGYLHFVLRMIAWLTTPFDPALVPALFVAAAASLTLYVAARTVSPRCPLPPSAGYALALVLVPDAGEVLLTLTNTQWVLAAALLLILISHDPQSWRQCIHDAGGVLALGLTGPFIIAMAPLFVWRAAQRRTRFSAMLAVAAMLCAATQAIVLLNGPGEPTQTNVAWSLILAIPGWGIASSLVTGGRLNAEAGIAAMSTIGALGLVGLLALTMCAKRPRTPHLCLLFTLFALLAMSLYRHRADLGALFYGAGDRYFYPLQLLSLWLIIGAAVASGRVAIIARALLIGIGVLNVHRLREPPLPDLNWPAYAARLRNGESVEIPVSPEGWSFTMPASYRPRPTTARPAKNQAGGRHTPLNFSSRCVVTSSAPMILGFVLHEGAPRRFLLRAVGPSLKPLGVAEPLEHPKLVVLKNGAVDPVVVATTNLHDDAFVATATRESGAFALDPKCDDAVAFATLGIGSYTIIVSGENAADHGTALVELYELPAP